MAEEESLIARYKNIIKFLLKTAECPICLDTIKVPLKLCRRGHGVCSSCGVRLQKCPICKASYELESPICLKNLLEALPRFCSFSPDGCDEILSKESEHDLFCGFRLTGCRQIDCKDLVPLNSIMNHIIIDHPSRYIYKTQSFVVTWYNFAMNSSRYDNLPVSVLNNIFWIFVMNDTEDKCFRLYFQVAPIGKMRNEYYARITFEKGQFVFVSTVKAFALILNETEHKNTSENGKKAARVTVGDSHPEEVEFMEIPHSSLKNLYTEDENSMLVFKVFIFEKVADEDDTIVG